MSRVILKDKQSRDAGLLMGQPAWTFRHPFLLKVGGTPW